MTNAKSRFSGRTRRHARVRSVVAGTLSRPRLSVFKSNRALYAQLIDDASAATIAAASSMKLKKKAGVEAAREVGKEIAKLAQSKRIKSVVFDRGGFRYAGAIKALAEGARQAGLIF